MPGFKISYKAGMLIACQAKILDLKAYDGG